MQTYRTAATARRGAFRQKLNPTAFSVEQDPDTKLWFIKTAEPAQPIEMITPEPVPGPVASSEPAPQPATKVRESKAISKPLVKSATKRNRKATATSPVAVVWSWLATGKNASMKRGDAIAALVALGVHPGTASTQRHKFLAASNAERTARVARYKEES